MVLCFLLLTIAALAAFVRVYGHVSDVFVEDSIRFPSTDPWAHVRQIEYLVNNFPKRLSFDPFGAYPAGLSVAVAPLLDYLVAVAAKLIAPLILYDAPVLAISAYTPPVLASMTTLAVYWIARKMFNRAVGLLAALLFAITPGVQFESSVLGFIDHHVLEVLLSMLTLGALLQAFHCAAHMSLETTAGHRPANYLRAAPSSMLFGLLLALYLLTWIGGSFLVLIVVAWVFCQAVAEHIKGKDAERVVVAVIPGALLALLVIVPFRSVYPLAGHQCLTLISLLFLVVFLAILSRSARRLLWPRYLFPSLMAVSAAGVAVSVYCYSPSLFEGVITGFGSKEAMTAERTIGEVRSLFWSEQGPTLARSWQLFATGYPLAVIGLVILAIRTIRHGNAGDVLLLAWSGAVLVAMIGQLRFGYYAAVNVSILASLACFKAVEHANILPPWMLMGSGAANTATAPVDSSMYNDRIAARSAEFSASRWQPVLLLAWVVALAIMPPAFALSRVVGAFTGPSDAWVEALKWMRDETPEPLGDPGAFFHIPDRFDESGHFDYPESAYGVMCWWDYGYWVTGIARRIPNAIPTQRGAPEAARFYTETNEAAALETLTDMGSRYVIVDGALPMLFGEGSTTPVGKFIALTRWAARPTADFFETFYQRTSDGRLAPVTLFFADYFRSMCIRLFLFDGGAHEPAGPFHVARFSEMTTVDGRKAKQLDEIRVFDSYDQAVAFLSSPGNEQSQLVSDDPTRSCVPLEPLEHFRLAYDAPSSIRSASDQRKEQVRIFAVQLDPRKDDQP